MTGAIRVLVDDDDPLVRPAVTMVLAGSPDLKVVGQVADGADVLRAVDAYAPDVVLMDIRMPKVHGLTATELLRARPDPPEIIVLTTFDTDEYVLRALRAGASGFLLKDPPPIKIRAAVSRVAAGEPILSPSVTRQLPYGRGLATDQRISGSGLRSLAEAVQPQSPEGDRLSGCVFSSKCTLIAADRAVLPRCGRADVRGAGRADGTQSETSAHVAL